MAILVNGRTGPTAIISRPIAPAPAPVTALPQPAIPYHPPTLYSPPVNSPVVSVSSPLPQPVRIGPAPAIPPVSPISGQPIQTSILMPNNTPASVVPQPNGYMEPLPYYYAGTTYQPPPAPPQTVDQTEFGMSQNFWLGLLLVVAILLVIGSK